VVVQSRHTDTRGDIPTPPIQPHSFLEYSHTSFEQCVAEFYTILFEEQVHVALEMLEGGGNLFLNLASKIDQSGSKMFKFGDCAG
jgi:hypothetical protein